MRDVTCAYNSPSDVYVILGPGQSWLLQAWCSPQSLTLDLYFEHYFWVNSSHPYGRSHTYFVKRYNANTSWALLYTWDWFYCHQNFFFFTIVLCLNMAKINHPVLDSESLAQCLLSQAEPSFIPTSPRSFSFQPWSLQEPTPSLLPSQPSFCVNFGLKK